MKIFFFISLLLVANSLKSQSGFWDDDNYSHLSIISDNIMTDSMIYMESIVIYNWGKNDDLIILLNDEEKTVITVDRKSEVHFEKTPNKVYSWFQGNSNGNLVTVFIYDKEVQILNLDTGDLIILNK